MTYTLLVETALGACGVGLAYQQEIRIRDSMHNPRAYAQHLAPIVQNMLKNARITSQDVAQVLVCTGPGSFTGVRVGMAFAKAFAYGCSVPCLGLSLFDAFANDMGTRDFLVALDTKCGDFYSAIYQKEQKPVYTILTKEKVEAYGEEGVLIFSDIIHVDYQPLPDILSSLITHVDQAIHNPSATYMRDPNVQS